MLLDAQALQRSAVVANCTMNRERNLVGSNSYARELRFDVLGYLRRRLRQGAVAWTDLCCGTARALIDATVELALRSESPAIRIEGVDLVGRFDPNPRPDILTLREMSLEEWRPIHGALLVTCVHGLHYVGDKLAAIAKAVASLAPDGLLLANLDLANFRDGRHRPMGRRIAGLLRANGLEYDARRRILSCRGGCDVSFDLPYLGADDQAGANYTGQPAVASCYDA